MLDFIDLLLIEKYQDHYYKINFYSLFTLDIAFVELVNIWLYNNTRGKMRKKIIFLNLITFGLYKAFLSRKIRTLRIRGQASSSKVTTDLIEFLGSISNIVSVKHKINSLEVYLKDTKIVNKDSIKILGATGMLTKKDSVVIVLGRISESVGKEITNLISKQI
jgi:phosphotransferase system IIB component